MLPRKHPDRIRVSFDDHRRVATAGLTLPATLARHLGLPQLVRQLGRVSRELLARPWAAGVVPDDAPCTSTWTPPSARPTDWPRRAPAITAIPASGGYHPCWPSPPAPAAC